MSTPGIHPEDAAIYAQQLHDDLSALTRAIIVLGNLLGEVVERELGEQPAIRVSQAGAWTITSYSVQP